MLRKRMAVFFPKNTFFCRKYNSFSLLLYPHRRSRRLRLDLPLPGGVPARSGVQGEGRQVHPGGGRGVRVRMPGGGGRMPGVVVVFIRGGGGGIRGAKGDF